MQQLIEQGKRWEIQPEQSLCHNVHRGVGNVDNKLTLKMFPAEFGVKP